jgi:hypothetical protein
LSWSVLTSSLRMSLFPCLLRKKYFTITRCSVQSIEMFLTHISNADQQMSSVPDPMDRFSRRIPVIKSEIDLVSRMLFCYWQFSVLRKIGRRSGTFSPKSKDSGKQVQKQI